MTSDNPNAIKTLESGNVGVVQPVVRRHRAVIVRGKRAAMEKYFDVEIETATQEKITDWLMNAVADVDKCYAMDVSQLTPECAGWNLGGENGTNPVLYGFSAPVGVKQNDITEKYYLEFRYKFYQDRMMSWHRSLDRWATQLAQERNPEWFDLDGVLDRVEKEAQARAEKIATRRARRQEMAMKTMRNNAIIDRALARYRNK